MTVKMPDLIEIVRQYHDVTVRPKEPEQKVKDNAGKVAYQRTYARYTEIL